MVPVREKKGGGGEAHQEISQLAANHQHMQNFMNNTNVQDLFFLFVFFAKELYRTDLAQVSFRRSKRYIYICQKYIQQIYHLL